MFLRELFEGPGKEASFALGRMNPAHRGHGLLVEAIKQGPGDAFLFLTDRAAKVPTDPLSPQEKLDWAQKSFPDITIALAKNIFPVAVDLYNKGYTDITIFEGEDKLRPLLEKYNGTEAAHGFFEFNNINQKKLSRDADADDASGASATKLRQAAMDGDFETFEDNVSDAAKPYAKKMFEKLQGILGGKKEEQVDEFALPAIMNTLRYGKHALTLGKFLWNNKWLISFSLVAWKSISWISDAMEFLGDIIDHPIVKGLLKYGLPAVGVAIAVYGGKKLYDELVSAEKEGKSRKEMTEVIKNFKPDNSYISDLEKELKAELKAAA
jgi:nicotinamide mononucleotide adenylyltransferase